MSKTLHLPRGTTVEHDAPDIQLVSETADLAKIAADEAFMHELLTVRIQASINKNDVQTVVITPNEAKHRAVIPRGVPTVVKRMVVEVLARMRETRYEQRQATNGDPESGNMLYSHTGQVYPFEVLKDANPKGRAWLENILAEPY